MHCHDILQIGDTLESGIVCFVALFYRKRRPYGYYNNDGTLDRLFRTAMNMIKFDCMYGQTLGEEEEKCANQSSVARRETKFLWELAVRRKFVKRFVEAARENKNGTPSEEEFARKTLCPFVWGTWSAGMHEYDFALALTNAIKTNKTETLLGEVLDLAVETFR